jgi:hypothetical protein
MDLKGGSHGLLQGTIATLTFKNYILKTTPLGYTVA